MKLQKKIYLVSREVLATSVKEALMEKGVVYSVQLAADNLQPEKEKPAGFKPKK